MIFINIKKKLLINFIIKSFKKLSNQKILANLLNK